MRDVELQDDLLPVDEHFHRAVGDGHWRWGPKELAIRTPARRPRSLDPAGRPVVPIVGGMRVLRARDEAERY